MNEAKQTPETKESLTPLDQGAASKVTHGDAVQWPFFEQGTPPFNHWCPDCVDDLA